MIRGRSQESRRRVGWSGEELPERCAQRNEGRRKEMSKFRNVGRKGDAARGAVSFDACNRRCPEGRRWRKVKRKTTRRNAGR
jgi:hypothetical protein